MFVGKWENQTFALQVRDRGRGRPRTADPVLRDNGYKDEKGRYQLADGLKPWHMRIVDYMLAYPRSTIAQLADKFSVTPQWMGQVLKSDAFKEYYSQRMAEHNQALQEQIVARLQGTALKALDKIDEELENATLTFGQKKDAAELSLKALGYTSNGQAVKVTVDQSEKTVVVQASADAVANARAKLQQKIQSTPIKRDAEAYQRVTTSLTENVEDIEDAVVTEGNDGTGN